MSHEQRKESLPCIICGARLLRDHDDYELQPDDGVMCSTSGNYGSTKVDYMNGERLHFNVCDPCIVKAGEEGRVAVTQHYVNVTTDVWVPRQEFGDRVYGGKFVSSIIGSMRVDRPIVPWHVGLAPLDEKFYIDGDEFAEKFEEYMADEKFSWNLGREGNEHIVTEWKEHRDE